MAGVTNSWKTDEVILGKGRIYGAVPVPANNARVAIDATDLTLDATTSAVHLGATKSGSILKVTTEWDEYLVDEFTEPIITNLRQTGMTLEGELVGALDLTLMERLTPGAGTYATAAGYEQLTIGSRTLVYQGIAVVAPRADDATKIVVAHIYKAMNTAGMQMNFAAKELNFTPFNFKGHSITTRDADDTLGIVWHTIA